MYAGRIKYNEDRMRFDMRVHVSTESLKGGVGINNRRIDKMPILSDNNRLKTNHMSEPENYRGPRRPDHPKWMERTGRELPDASPYDTDITRRAALAAIGGSLVGGFAFLRNFFNHRSQFALAVDSAEKLADTQRTPEKLPNGCLIPEDERTGKTILTSILPEHSSLPIVGGYDFNNSRSASADPILSALPEGTTVELMVPEESGEAALEYASKLHPHLKFGICEVPAAEDGFTYPQDGVYATGSKDKEGRFLLAGNAFDSKLYRADLTANFRDREYAKYSRAMMSQDSLNDLRMGEDNIQTAGIAMRLFGDDFLAKSYPGKFNLKHLPVMTVGGDLPITRLPNGKVALIMGKENLSRMIQMMQTDRIGKDVDVREINEIDKDQFLELMEKVKALYRDSFGVEVIILDEPYITREVKRNGYLKHSGLRSYGFFHADMLVKTATNPDGKALAFCSSNAGCSNESGDCRYLPRIQEQFAGLGYQVVPIETGPYPVMNYANSLMFRPDQKRRIVLLPQYGIPQDAAAERAYLNQGFEVRKVDQSYIQRLSLNEKALLGGPHCKAVILE